MESQEHNPNNLDREWCQIQNKVGAGEGRLALANAMMAWEKQALSSQSPF